MKFYSLIIPALTCALAGSWFGYVFGWSAGYSKGTGDERKRWTGSFGKLPHYI